MHPHLVYILDARAKEANLSRSAYLERVIIGWVQADPRNPRIDSRGMFIPGAQSPRRYQETQASAFGAKFKTFSDAHEVILGTPAPQRWIEEPDRYMPAEYEPPEDEELSDQAKAWIAKRLKPK
ncbi:hypothetical protein [Bradyrhizobium sp. SSBR45G]|uniref:hypothetical protein n=1 Tax=Bradyrhizobium sp. SSBR45G TaxID=2996008 RepID=UPI0024E0BBDC|nr:hypothetical protein [Bradyrhizobium sp. SSBR45G]